MGAAGTTAEARADEWPLAWNGGKTTSVEMGQGVKSSCLLSAGPQPEALTARVMCHRTA